MKEFGTAREFGKGNRGVRAYLPQTLSSSGDNRGSAADVSCAHGNID
jgi:hypothetical protein